MRPAFVTPLSSRALSAAARPRRRPPQEKGEVRVLNNGAGVPVEVHKTEGIYVPELIFGHLLTSSNYNDSEKKVTGGRNGYGAKLANIFSRKFTVETCDGKRKRRYKQVFKNNMTHKGEPAISDCKAADNWTCISFQPDLERFSMEKLDEDIGERADAACGAWLLSCWCEPAACTPQR
jgi:DNA topoisomerase-2